MTPWQLPPPGSLLPVGTVISYAGPLADTDGGSGVNLAQIQHNLFDAGWLYCDGRACSCEQFWILYGVIGNSFGHGTDAHHKATFNLPDLRGRFVRGVSGSATDRDPDASHRVASDQNASGANGNKVGSAQDDAFQGHEHQYTSTQIGAELAQPEGPPTLAQLPEQPTTGVLPDQAHHGVPRTASETRPVNIYLNYLIRYR